MQTMYQDHGPEEFEEQEIHLRDYLRIISKRKYTILTVFAIVFLATAVKTFTTTPIYSASSQVLIERNLGNKGLDEQYRYYDPDFLDTQSEIIMSANVARKVVDKLQLASRYRHYFFKNDGDSSVITVAKDYIRSLISPVLQLLKNSPESNVVTTEMTIPGAEPKTDEEIIAEIIRGGLSVSPVQKHQDCLDFLYRSKPFYGKACGGRHCFVLHG